MNYHYESKLSPEQSFCCACLIYAAMLVFFGIFAFNDPDDGRACFVQKVWSPAVNTYMLKETDYFVDGMDNVDISGRFHWFFTTGFYAYLVSLCYMPFAMCCILKM